MNSVRIDLYNFLKKKNNQIKKWKLITLYMDQHFIDSEYTWVKLFKMLHIWQKI